MSWLDIIPIFGSILGGGNKDKDQVLRDNKVTTTGKTSETTNQTTDATTKTAESSKNTTTNKGFSDAILSQIDTMLGGLLGGQSQVGNQGAVDSRVSELASRSDSFDTAGFVNGIVNSAASTMASDREQNVNALASKAGGGADGNSMLALLKAKMESTDAAALAGVKSTAERDAAAIQTGMSESKTSQLNQTAQTSNSMLSTLLQTLAGQNGTQTSKGSTTSLATELQKLLQTNAGTSSLTQKTDYEGI